MFPVKWKEELSQVNTAFCFARVPLLLNGSEGKLVIRALENPAVVQGMIKRAALFSHYDGERLRRLN